MVSTAWRRRHNDIAWVCDILNSTQQKASVPPKDLKRLKDKKGEKCREREFCWRMLVRMLMEVSLLVLIKNLGTTGYLFLLMYQGVRFMCYIVTACYCRRSGNIRCVATPKRSRKWQRSCKINNYCKSWMDRWRRRSKSYRIIKTFLKY